MNKQKICKKGIGKALGFDGCGSVTWKTEMGLCHSCLYDFFTKTEAGKIIFEKRKIKVKAKNWKEEKSKLKESVKTLSQYEAEAKKSFQKWIRLRDENLPCISCGTFTADEWHGSHYFDANRYSGLIFDERNVNRACKQCNVFFHGNIAGYRKGLILRYGFEFVEQLENESDSKRNYKYTKDELIKIKSKYDTKIKNNDFS